MQGSPRIDELRQKFHENPRRYFAPLANEYRKAGDPEQAIAICRAHLAQQPGHMSGHVVYGQALYDADRAEEARSVFEKALSLDPENVIVLRQLGDIAREKGESGEARHWYGKALDIDPMDSEVAAYIAELTEPLMGDAGPAVVAESQAVGERTVDVGAQVEAEGDVLEEVEEEAQQGIVAASPADDQGDGFEEPAEVTPDAAPEAAVDETEAIFVMSDALVDAGTDETHHAESAAPLEPQPAEDASAAPGGEDGASAPAEQSAAAEDAPWRNTPQAEKSPFVTRTMAELYASQGYPDAALDIYRQLAIQHPDDMEIRDRIDELSSGPEVGEPFSFSELTDDVIYRPTSEDMSLTGDGHPLTDGLHFTEMALGDGGGVEEGFGASEFPEFTEISWDGSLADFSEISLDDPGEDAAPSGPPIVLESTSDPIAETVADEAVSEPDLELTSSKVDPPYEDIAVAAVAAEPDAAEPPATEPDTAEPPATEPDTAEPPATEPDTAEPDAPKPYTAEPPAAEPPAAETHAHTDVPVEEATSDARFVELPVALGEFQTSIDEAGVTTTSPHDSDITLSLDPDFHEEFRGDEAAAAMASGGASATEAESAQPAAELKSKAAPAFESQAAPSLEPQGDEWGADDFESIESEVVAYSPELPAHEDIPHYTPKSPTMREFFATLGALRPPDSNAAESFTARAAIPDVNREPPADDLPLATEAFDSLFPDDPPISEEDTRAAFALSAALSGAAHNPVPASLRTSPPLPTPAVTEPSAEARESEEDIRRFREWLDGLADS